MQTAEAMFIVTDIISQPQPIK